MNDENQRDNKNGSAEGSGLTELEPGDTAVEGGQGGTGASGNAVESEPDSAREKIQRERSGETD